MFLHRLVISSVLCIVSFAQNDRQGRIVRGQSVGLGEIPYQVSIRERNFHFCGGALINDRSILTAAICLHGRRGDSLNLVAGVVSLNAIGQSRRSHTIAIHPLFEPHSFGVTTVNHNIGVVETLSPFVLNGLVFPIRINPTIMRVSDWAVVSGFGATSSDGGANSISLQALTVVTIGQDVSCVSDGIDVDKRFNICAFNVQHNDFNNNAGFCTTDVGGPLVFRNELIGIASFNVPCAIITERDVYVALSAYRNWIGSVTGI